MTIIYPHYSLLSSPTPTKAFILPNKSPFTPIPSTRICVYMCRCVHVCMYECLYVPSSLMKVSHCISMSGGIVYQCIGS